MNNASGCRRAIHTTPPTAATASTPAEPNTAISQAARAIPSSSKAMRKSSCVCVG